MLGGRWDICLRMGAGKNIEHTPALAVFTVFMFFLIVSFALETFFHKLHHYFEHKKQKGLLKALEKVKDELMLMGFCSLILIVFEPEIMLICTDMRTIRAVPAQIWYKCPCANLYMHSKYPYLRDVDATYFKENDYEERLDGSRFGTMHNTVIESNGGRKPDGYNFTDLASYCCDEYPKSCIPGCKPSKGCNAEYLSSSGAYSSYGRRLSINQDSLARSLKQVQVNTCAEGQSQFIEQQALHQTHTIIFYIAMMHITLGVILLSATTWRVKKWTKWESYGKDEDEKIEHLNVPQKRKGLMKYLCVCKEQFTDSIDPAAYIAIRVYYIARNCDVNVVHHHPEAYKFGSIVQAHMTHVTGEMLGIEWWMWLTLGIQILLEGYGWGTLNVFTMTAAFVMVLAGSKLQGIAHHLTRTVYTLHGCLGQNKEESENASGKGALVESKFHEMQRSLDFNILADVEPDFWCQRPSIMSSMIKFCLWQNSVSLTLFLYYGVKYEQFDQMHTCYWESRTILGTLPDIVIILFTLILSGSRVLPVYSMVSLASEHYHEKGILSALVLDWHHHGHTVESHMKGMERASHFAKEKSHDVVEHRKQTVVVPVNGGTEKSGASNPKAELSNWGR